MAVKPPVADRPEGAGLTTKRRPRGSLNQQVILDAAFAVTERGGLDVVVVAHALPAVDDPENFTLPLGLMIEALRARAAVAHRP